MKICFCDYSFCRKKKPLRCRIVSKLVLNLGMPTERRRSSRCFIDESVVFFQAAAVVRLSKLTAFKEVQTYINLNRADFFEWLESGKPERSVPSCWDSKMSLSKLNNYC